MIRNYDIAFTYFDEQTGVDIEVDAIICYMSATNDEPGELTVEHYSSSAEQHEDVTDEMILDAQDRAYFYTEDNMRQLIRDSLVEQF